MTSPIYQARQWIHDQLVAHADLAGVEVTYGAPTYHAGYEVVSVAGVTAISDEDRVLGGSRIEREFTVDVAFLAQSEGSDSAEWVDERGFEFYEIIRSVVTADRTLGGTVRQSIPEGLDTEGAIPVEGGGWVIVGVVHVRCETRTV